MRFPGATHLVVLGRKWTDKLTDWVESKLEGKFGLEINREKTRVVEVRPGRESLDFLGIHVSVGSGPARPLSQLYERVAVGEGCGTGTGEVKGDDGCSSMPYADPGTGEPLESTPERLGELLLLRLPARRLVGDRLVRARPLDPTFATAQSKAVSSAERSAVVRPYPEVRLGFT